jgi:hypothetical protein
LEEAGLRPEEVVSTVPSYWTSSGETISQDSLAAGGLGKTWTEDPYLGKGSSYYDANPATRLLPESAPSSYPYYGIPGDSMQVTSSGVWIETPSGLKQPDYWVWEKFISKIKTDPEVKSWYYSLSDADRTKVFANYIATGQIYL